VQLCLYLLAAREGCCTNSVNVVLALKKNDCRVMPMMVSSYGWPFPNTVEPFFASYDPGNAFDKEVAKASTLQAWPSGIAKSEQ